MCTFTAMLMMIHFLCDQEIYLINYIAEKLADLRCNFNSMTIIFIMISFVATYCTVSVSSAATD